MGMIYGLGMFVIWFAPDTTGKKLEDWRSLLRFMDFASEKLAQFRLRSET